LFSRSFTCVPSAMAVWPLPLFKLNQPGGSLGRCQLLQMRGAVGIDAQFGIGRETGVNCSGKRRQFSFQSGGKILPSFGNTESGTVGRQPCFAFCPRQELGTIVSEGLGADNVEVAGLQGVGQVDEYADLKRPPIESARLAPGFGDETLPTLGREADVDFVQHFVATRVTVTTYDRQCIEQAAVLNGRLDIHQVEQSEQQGAVPGMDWPEQRQLVTVVPCRHCLVLFRQCRNATLLRQELSDVAPEYGVRVLCLFGFQYLAKGVVVPFAGLTSRASSIVRCSVVTRMDT
jgi:hypothetical protein